MIRPVNRNAMTQENAKLAPSSNWTSSFAVDFLCVFCIFFIYAGSSVPAINEPHYWTKAAHFWNPDFGKGDLFLESGDAHWLFFASFGYLTQCMPISWAVWTGRFLTWIFLAVGWTMLGRALWFECPNRSQTQPRDTSVRPMDSPMIASSWGLIWLVGLHYGHWAGEWVIGGCESKGIAYAMIFAGLALAIRQRWTLAWTLLGGAAAYHVVTGIWVIACVVTVSFLLDYRKSTKQIGELGANSNGLAGWFAIHRIGWGLCFIGVIVGALPALAIDWGTDPILASESAVKQVYTRLGHHLAPTRFSTIRWQDFGGQLLCACLVFWMASRSKWLGTSETVSEIQRTGFSQGNILSKNYRTWAGVFATFPRGLQLVIGWGLFGFAVAMLGLLVDLAFGKAFPKLTSKLLRFYLFRWNDVAMPMMIGSLVVSFAYGRLAFTPNPVAAKWLARAGLLVPGFILLGYRFEANYHETIPAGDKAHFAAKSDSESDQIKQFEDWRRVCDWIRQNSDVESLWLTPRRQQSFKWHTGRPELACWKDAPQNAAALVEWSQRLADAYQFDKTKTLQPWTTEKLRELQGKYGIRYVLLDRRVVGQSLPLLPILYPTQNEFNETFAVFELPSQNANVSR